MSDARLARRSHFVSECVCCQAGQALALVLVDEVVGWRAGLDGLLARFAHRFGRTQPRRQALSYLVDCCRRWRRGTAGLLAEAAGNAMPDRMQGLLRDWLVEHQVTPVGKESTSDYWKPVFYLLESVVACWPLNARHMRAVPGHKTVLVAHAYLAVTAAQARRGARSRS
ncbi:hypothetical protein ACQEVC_42420 [Plantactinospora sp. CA-294935]|uniref:hypothetical protein n=1 Tax=Plantactinospora sp. CA-294935 TaxID=3240012 RepID=UPI003D8FD114